MDEWEVHPRLAVAAAMAAQTEGVARITKPPDELRSEATRTMREAREATAVLMRAGLIPAVPDS
jgi:hypothetical protein